MNQSASKTIYPALTGLRWIAAFCVWLHHFPPPLPLPDACFAFFKELHIGVPIFFVLSGFLITLRYSEEARINRGWLGNYARNRVARIMPIYLLVTLVALVAIPLFAGDAIAWRTLFLNVTLLRGFFDDFKFTGVAQGWSLTVEECFYFSAPLIFLLWRGWKVKTRWILLSLYAIGLVLWGIGGQLSYHGLFSPLKFVIGYTYFGHALSFLAGAWLARRVLEDRRINLRLPPWLSMTNCGAVAIIVLVAVVACGQSPEFRVGSANPPFMALFYFGGPPAICLLIAGLISERTLISRLLSTPVFVLLGKASYCFYLIHMGYLQFYLHKLMPKPWKANRYWAEFVLLIAAAIVLYLLVEKPMNRLIRKRREK